MISDAESDKSAEAALPTLKPIEAKLSAAEKRERQRLHVKRTYYRKLQLMQGLRNEVEKLEDEYARRLSAVSKRDGRTMASSPQRESTAIGIRDQPHVQPIHLREAYDNLCRTKEKLRAENQALRGAIEAQERLALQLRCIMIEEQPMSSNYDGSRKFSVTHPSTGPSVDVAPITLREKISVEACQEIARSTFADMLRFRESHGFVTTGLSVFGWRDRRLVQGDRFKFSMKKLFLDITPFELSLRGWSVVTSNHLSSLYSSPFNVKTYTLHQVDDDNIVRYRIMSSPDGRYLVKTLFLTSRFESELGYTYVMRSIDHKKWVAPYQDPPGVQEQWIDYYNWSIFEAEGDRGQHCKLDFGGMTHLTPVMGSDAWMLEVLSIMLRWENIVIGPMFSLCAE